MSDGDVAAADRGRGDGRAGKANMRDSAVCVVEGDGYDVFGEGERLAVGEAGIATDSDVGAR